MTGNVLIVRHGPGRGRNLEILPMIQAYIAASRPSFATHFRVHATGSPLPDLTGVVAILFLLGDPLREFYPECYAEAVVIAEEGQSRGVKLLNPPQNLSNGVKSRQAALWQKAGLPCARARVITTPDDLEPAMAALGLPMIIRSDDTHVQEGVRVCRRVKHVDDAKLTLACPAVALQMIDVRAEWRKTEPGSIFARYHHKKRAMVYGDIIINNHVFFASSPIVGRATSTFRADSRRARRWLRRVGVGHKRFAETVAIDSDFFNAPAEAPELMFRAVEALGLHMGSIDYSRLPDGGIVLWETNSYVHLPPWQHGVLARPRRIQERTARQIEVVVAWLERLAAGEDLRR